MFYNPELPLRKHQNHLPHWQQDSSWVFVTWRLADSVPIGLTVKWQKQRDEWLALHPKPWDTDKETEYHKLFSTQLEEWMDQGMGECILRDPKFANIVGKVLLHFHAERYFVDSFVIMPNHVHLLVRLMPSVPMEKNVQSWKRYSARLINEARNTSGSLWHKRYWDTLVRSEEHFWKIRRYILKNSVKAKLRDGEYLLYAPWHR
ncbi:MAG: transposase [Akkermansiaceae bacterium]